MDRIGFPGFATYSNLPSNLLAGPYPVDDVSVTLLGGVKYVEGSVLGKITSGPNAGMYTLASLDNGATPPVATADGSQQPRGVLPFDVDATGGPQNASIYVSGDFDEAKLIMGSGLTLATLPDALGARPIFLKSVTPTY